MHSGSAHPLLPPTVLIVDDDPPILDLLSEALGEEGFLVSTAGDLPTALAALDAQPFDLVLADSLASFDEKIVLDCWTALDMMLGRAGRAGVVIFSAHPARYFAGLRERGFVGFVAKPFDLDQLAAVLRGHLSSASGPLSRAGVL
jgi:two-component system capsular synthesis sensor histidine kinase RcsC